MAPSDPVPGGAPEPEPPAGPSGEPPAGRLPAGPISFAQAAERFGRLSGDRPPPGPHPTGEAAGDGGGPDRHGAPEPAGAPATAFGAEPGPVRPAAGTGARAAFRHWRGRRPFLGGVLMTLGGAEVLASERASFGVVVHVGMEGLSGYLVPAVLVVCGVLTLANPGQRLFYSVLGVLLSLGSWVTSNLGGFFVGLLLGLAGSCLAFGWLPDQEPRTRRFRRPRPGPRREEAGEREAAAS